LTPAPAVLATPTRSAAEKAAGPRWAGRLAANFHQRRQRKRGPGSSPGRRACEAALPDFAGKAAVPDTTTLRTLWHASPQTTECAWSRHWSF